MKLRQRSKILLFVFGISLLLLAGWGTFHLLGQNRPISVDELWDMYYEGKTFQGKGIVVRGNAFLHPQFHRLWLLNPEMELPTAYWFGVEIDELTCEVSDTTMICQPFDPTQATAFEFRGTLHLRQMGKLTFMGLSDIDFEHSRQLIDGKWQSIPIGKFELSVEGE